MNDGTLAIWRGSVRLRNVCRFGFVVHPSVVHVVDSHEVLSLCLVIFLMYPLRQKLTNIVNCNSLISATDESDLVAFYEKLEEVIRNENSFYRFGVGYLNAKQGKDTEEERTIG
ncbi:hypothetical protein RB195_014361 [Necator americanus]|uniref:Uncharacterized protein n=1 Tax=Necator americanus TaxID=51031 RepID=A0ABR1E0Y9_NECAM